MNNMPNMNTTNRNPYANSLSQLNLRLASLNCNSLYKPSKPDIRRDMIRFLRESSYDIISVQESHTTTAESISLLDQQFQSKSSLWTSRCGIISTNPNIHLSIIDTPSIIDGRIILAEITHSAQYFQPFYILNIYAPSSNTASARTNFYDSLLTLPSLSLPQIRDRLIIMGDFNYSYLRRPQMRTIPTEWTTFLHSHFKDCLTIAGEHPVPTFHRNTAVQSTIDYIYISSSLHPQTSNGETTHISREWTDHNLISIELSIDSTPTGRGVWRFNPLLLKKEHFRNQLTITLTKLYSKISHYNSVQEQWDQVKEETKRFSKKFGAKHVR